MKKNTYLFVCSISILIPQSGDVPREFKHSFRELVEIGKDDTVPVVFDKWITDCTDDLMSKQRAALAPKPILTFAYVLAS